MSTRPQPHRDPASRHACLPFFPSTLLSPYFDGLHFKPALFMQSKSSSSLSMWSAKVAVAITTSSTQHVTRFPYFPQSLKGHRGIAHTERHPLPLVQAQFTCKSSFSLSFFRRGTCQKAEPRCSVVKILTSPSSERLSSIRGIGKTSFMVTAFR